MGSNYPNVVHQMVTTCKACNSIDSTEMPQGWSDAAGRRRKSCNCRRRDFTAKSATFWTCDGSLMVAPEAALVPDGGRRLEDFAKVDSGLSKDFAVFTTTTTTATTTSKASCHVVDGSNCGQGLEIVSSEACKAAADALDITYKRENMKGKWKHTP